MQSRQPDSARMDTTMSLKRILVRATAVTWASAILAEAQEPTRSVWQGVYSAAQSERGAAVYKQSCGMCHGENLAGDIGPTLTGPFWSIWEGRTAADLMKTIRTTMPADAPESLKPQEYADLVAYLFSVNKFPAGEKELPVDQAALENIKIVKQ